MEIFRTNDRREWYRQEYLKSDHWKNLRAAKLKQNPACEKCGSVRNLDVHHKSYRNLFDVTLDMLQTLCRRCHTDTHHNPALVNPRPVTVTAPKTELWGKSHYFVALSVRGYGMANSTRRAICRCLIDKPKNERTLVTLYKLDRSIKFRTEDHAFVCRGFETPELIACGLNTSPEIQRLCNLV